MRWCSFSKEIGGWNSVAYHAGTRVDHHSGLFVTLKITETPKIFSSPTILERAEHEGHKHSGIQELKIQTLFVVSWSSVVLRFFSGFR